MKFIRASSSSISFSLPFSRGRIALVQKNRGSCLHYNCSLVRTFLGVFPAASGESKTRRPLLCVLVKRGRKVRNSMRKRREKERGRPSKRKTGKAGCARIVRRRENGRRVQRVRENGLQSECPVSCQRAKEKEMNGQRGITQPTDLC